VLVIDALDEALEMEPAEDRKRVTIVDLLAKKAAQFPRWLRLLATSRPIPEVLRPLKARYTLREIDAEDSRNQADLRQYVLARAFRGAVRARLGDRTPEDFADSLVEKSGGKFLFVVHALRELELGSLSVEKLLSLPPGMDAFYLDSFERRFGAEAETYDEARDLLGVMCAAQEPLARAELAEILGLTEDSVETIHSRLPDFLRLRGEGLNFDHLSLREWLTEWDEEGLRRAGRFAVLLQEAESRIRSWALSRVEAGAAHASTYLLRHLSAHLHDGPERRRVYAELLFERFVWSQSRLEVSGVSGLLEDTLHIKGEPEQALLQALVRNSEPALRRSATHWPGQLLGRLGTTVATSIGLPRLVSSAERWLLENDIPDDVLTPCTRSLPLALIRFDPGCAYQSDPAA
jgi:hypothetical protein